MTTIRYILKTNNNRLIHALAVTALWLIHVAVWELGIAYARVAKWELRRLYNLESINR
jgi:hypothetical protein